MVAFVTEGAGDLSRLFQSKITLDNGLFENVRQMKKTRYSDEQFVRILRETDKDPVAEIALQVRLCLHLR